MCIVYEGVNYWRSYLMTIFVFDSIDATCSVYSISEVPCYGVGCRRHNSSSTKSTGTAHTSAKARLATVAIPIRIRIRDPDRHQNLIICSSSNFQPSLKISCKSAWTFCTKLLTDRQTNKCVSRLARRKSHHSA